MKFSWSESKYGIWMLILCVIFVFIVANSFRYLPSSNPEKESTKQSYTEDRVSREEISEREYSDREISENRNDRTDIRDNEINTERRQNRNDIPDLEIITSSEDNPIEPVSGYKKAEQLFKEQKYESAVHEYQKIAEDSSDTSVKAECYYNIASIYGKIKRYGTALSFAQRSYNTEPTTERELLLARLYYKTGNTEQATDHINDILKRDFSSDKN